MSTDPRIDEGVAGLQEFIKARSPQKQVGWKLGFGSPSGRAALKISHPLVGALFTDGEHDSNQPLEIDDCSRPMIEAEIVAWIGADISETASEDEIFSAIRSLQPGIEIADLAFQPDDLVRVMSTNIYHRNWIVSKPNDASSPNLVSFDDLSVNISHNETMWENISDPQELTGSILSGIKSCAEVASHIGRGLIAGDFIFLGSVIPPQLLNPGDIFSVGLEGSGSVSVTISG